MKHVITLAMLRLLAGILFASVAANTSVSMGTVVYASTYREKTADTSYSVGIPLIFDAVRSFRNGYAPVSVNGKWGFIDRSGRLIVAPAYDDVMEFSEGFAGVQVGDKWGYIDESCRSATPIRYDNASSFSEGLVVEQDSFTCIVYADSVKIVKYNGFAPQAIVPSTVMGKPVTSIGTASFLTPRLAYPQPNMSGNNTPYTIQSSDIQEVILPEGVISLDDGAFASCINLRSIILPDSLLSIGSSAFYSCTNLATVTMGSSLQSISSHAFYGCNNLTRISLPDSIISIGEHAFSYCDRLSAIELPNRLETISEYAFQSCESLKTINLPSTVTSIGVGVFWRCSSLSAINVDPANECFFSDAGVLYSKDPIRILCYPDNKKGFTVRIPDGVTEVGTYAFYGNKHLRLILLSESVQFIEEKAFFVINNSNLIAVYFPGDIDYLPDGILKRDSAEDHIINPIIVSNSQEIAIYAVNNEITYYTIHGYIINRVCRIAGIAVVITFLVRKVLDNRDES